MNIDGANIDTVEDRLDKLTEVVERLNKTTVELMNRTNMVRTTMQPYPHPVPIHQPTPFPNYTPYPITGTAYSNYEKKPYSPTDKPYGEFDIEVKSRTLVPTSNDIIVAKFKSTQGTRVFLTVERGTMGGRNEYEVVLRIENLELSVFSGGPLATMIIRLKEYSFDAIYKNDTDDFQKLVTVVEMLNKTIFAIPKNRKPTKLVIDRDFELYPDANTDLLSLTVQDDNESTSNVTYTYNAKGHSPVYITK